MANLIRPRDQAGEVIYVDPQKIIMIEPIGDEPDGPLGVAVVEGGIRDLGADEGGERTIFMIARKWSPPRCPITR